jgi:hypothetical protein
MVVAETRNNIDNSPAVTSNNNDNKYDSIGNDVACAMLSLSTTSASISNDNKDDSVGGDVAPAVLSLSTTNASISNDNKDDSFGCDISIKRQIQSQNKM